MHAAPLSSILIAGGGLAGWGFAGLLARALGPSAPAIRVLDTGGTPPEPALSTLPAIRELHARLGLADTDAVSAARGSFKLGERFTGWTAGRGDAFLPYGAIGADIGPVRFHQQLARLGGEDAVAAYPDYSLAAEAARCGRFAPPARDPRSIASTLDYGLHLDAQLHAGSIERAAGKLGAGRIEGRIGEAVRDPRGHIRQVRLEDGRSIEADFWIDATADGLLSPQGWQDWSADTPFDRIATVRIDRKEAPPPFTQNTALGNGWVRETPLRDGLVRQYVHASAFAGDRALEAALGTGADIAATGWSTGCRPDAWNGNCLSIGPAAWRTGPLAAAGCALLTGAADRFVRLLPHIGRGEAEAREYNRLFGLEIAGVRDFSLVFQHAQSRPEPVWQACREAPKTAALDHALALFRSRGRVARAEGRIHDETRWTAALLAMNLVPRRHDPQAGTLGLRALTERTARIRGMVQAAAAAMPAHADVLDRIHAGVSRA